MFDFHLHTVVSYDGHNTPEEMALAARDAGLKEICFTDHLDYELGIPKEQLAYTVEAYNHAYDALVVPGLLIRNGAEIGMTPWNVEEVSKDLSLRHYDFVIGSVHHADNMDMYLPPFWEGKTVQDGELRCFQEILRCVQLHDNFDVLGHLTYISKTGSNPGRRLVPYGEYRELTDEIMKVLIAKGKGIEVNTSGTDRVGDFLPHEEYLRRFKELGGEIVTVGSDAHNCARVGQYTDRACAMLKDIFGYVCTFRDRKPIFHKL